MDEDALNMSIRKFLKMVGVSSQREIEHAVEQSLAARKVEATATLPVTMTLDVPALGLKKTFEGTISLG